MFYPQFTASLTSVPTLVPHDLKPEAARVAGLSHVAGDGTLFQVLWRVISRTIPIVTCSKIVIHVEPEVNLHEHA